LTTLKFFHVSSNALAALAARLAASYPRVVTKPTDILGPEAEGSPRHFVSLRNA